MKEGTLLNARYQILELLGSGGMAEVFRARDLMLDRYIAIKVLRADYSKSAEFQDRFRQEARAAANLSHPNIVTVHDVGMAEDQLFIIMEYVPGRDLKTLLRQHGRLQLQTAIPLMIQACAGIGYATGRAGPGCQTTNMLVTPDQRLKVTDFGIARALATMVPGEREDCGVAAILRPSRPGKVRHPPRMCIRWASCCMN
jgi:serine/threonine-protein kinase